MSLRAVLGAAALLALLATPVAPAAPPTDAKVVIWERTLTYALIATHGVEAVGVPASFKNVEMRLALAPGACSGLAAVVNVAPVPPPPIPPALLSGRINCSGGAAYDTVGAPIPVYQAAGRPLLVEFAGAGSALVRLTVLGEPWS